jgi:type VI secretion system protein ImpJ
MAISKLNPVAWTEGMFLRPQHLQQHDLFADARLRYHTLALNPFHWGVRELRVDEEAIAKGRIVVERLEAVLPDGTVVRVPGNATIESRSFEVGQERIEVFLALREWSVADPNLVDEGSGTRHARYRIDEVKLPDLNRGGPPGPVEVLTPNLRLLLSGEEAEFGLYESFKLLEIEATDDSSRPFAVSRSYVPPLLSIQASPVLREDFARIVNQVSARVRVAAGQTRTLAVESVPKLFMRYTLARTAPLLRHLESTGETSPFGLFTVLVELAGALGWFRHEDAVTLPVYDHANPYPCFRDLFKFISTELERLAPEGFTKLAMPFEPALQAYATKGLNVQLVDPRNSFYLAIRAPIEAQVLAEQVVAHGKASSAKGVGPIVKFKVPGLLLERLPGAPTEIESMAGYLYFRIDPHGKEWVKVRDEFSFALHLGKLENASVFLYVAVAERGT